MISYVTGIALVVLVWILTYYQCSAKVWLPMTGVALALSNFFHLLSVVSLIILDVLWMLLFLFAILQPLRILLLIKPLFKWFQRENPKLSPLEQQVIDAGGVWWGNELFKGQPNWASLFSEKPASLTQPEQEFLNNQVTQLCDLLDDWKICHLDHDLSPEAWQFIKSQGFWAIEMDPKYGGLGFSPLAHSTIISKIASCSISAAITVMVPNSLGPAEFLKYYGTAEQKNDYLPRLAKGEEIACFALTGVEAGSDAGGITDTGIVCRGEYQGRTVLGIRLNWNKRYITLAPIATLIGLAFHLLDPDHLLGNQENIGITLALIPANCPGIEKGARHLPLNMGFMNGPIRGHDVFVPLESIIGGREHLGQGWRMMMECLVVGRGISLPSLATAISQFCLRMSSAYTVVRHQFNRPIIKFESIQQALGRIGGLTYLSEALQVATLQSILEGGRPAVASAITKYHLTEFSRQIVNDSMDIHAGKGIQLGPSNYLSFLYQATPINITVEGANILTRGLIIYGQGLLRCHPFLRNELTAATNNDLPSFDKIFRQHIGFILSQFSRLLVYGITGGRLIFAKMPGRLSHFSPYFRQLTRMSNSFAILTDITLLILGKQLKAKEALSGRLADTLSHLYMAVSVVKHYQQQGFPADQEIFMEWGIHYCFGKIQESIMDFLANFPSQWVAKILRRLIFPWGMPYSGPADRVSGHIATELAQNLNLRQQLSRHCYIQPQSPAGKMEQAMMSLLEMKLLLAKIACPIKVDVNTSPFESHLSAKIRDAVREQKITDEERRSLQNAADLCWAAIQVDEFL